MRIMQQQLLNRRLPSYLGFFFLVLAIVTIIWLSRNAILFGTLAAHDNTPRNVQISNVTDNSFTISYTTDSPVVGTVTLGAVGKTSQVVLDDRDVQQKTPAEYATHSLTVNNLAPSTTYTFTITSGNENYLDGEKAYQITTGPPLTIDSSDAFVSGKVTNDDGSPVAGALVYTSTSNSQILSTITNASGEYKLNLKTMRTNDFTSQMNLDDGTKLTIQIIDATRKSDIAVLTGQTDPIPLIILSKNYDFAISTEPLAPSPVASDSADLSGTPVAFPTAEESTNTNPAILTPQKEQEFKDQQPLFRGKAVPNETVTITINSDQTINATVTADESGNWQYRPKETLEPGTHTITIRTTDASGLMRVITQSFVVYAEGSQFTEPSISPSGSVTTTPKATATPTPIKSGPTQQPTNTPVPTKAGTTATPIPTKSSTPTPTKKPTATITVSRPPIPVTGNTSLLLTVVGVVSAITIGALLFIFTTV